MAPLMIAKFMLSAKVKFTTARMGPNGTVLFVRFRPPLAKTQNSDIIRRSYLLFDREANYSTGSQE